MITTLLRDCGLSPVIPAELALLVLVLVMVCVVCSLREAKGGGDGG